MTSESGIALGGRGDDHWPWVDTANARVAFGFAAQAGPTKNLIAVRAKSSGFKFDPKVALPQFSEDFFVKVI